MYVFLLVCSLIIFLGFFINIIGTTCALVIVINVVESQAVRYMYIK